MLITTLLLCSSAWLVENRKADIVDKGDFVQITTHEGPGDGVSMLTELPVAEWRGKRVTLSADLQMFVKESHAAAYILVARGSKVSVYSHFVDDRMDAETSVHATADIPDDATVILAGLWQKDTAPRPLISGLVEKPVITTVKHKQIAESRASVVSPRADFVNSMNQPLVGSNIMTFAWMRNDDSRIKTDGTPTAFLRASLIDRWSFLYNYRRYSR